MAVGSRGRSAQKKGAATRRPYRLASLYDLYVDHITDLHSAERQIATALPKVARATTSPDLKTAFQQHLEETRDHIARLREILHSLGVGIKAKQCKGMAGLLKEGDALVGERAAAAVKDAGLIAVAQRVKHYEMAAYGCLCAYAELLDQGDALRVLRQTFDEEARADARLTDLSIHINDRAAGLGNS